MADGHHAKSQRWDWVVREREKRYADLVKIARLVSWCIDRNLIVRESLEHIQERLGKRARCYFLENGELAITCWTGEHRDDLAGSKRCLRESIVWEVFKRGVAVNLTERSSTEGYQHTLGEKVKIKAIMPLRYLNAFTQQEKKFGVVVVDSGKEQIPISREDFEYLQVVGDLIGEAVGKAELVDQLISSYERRDEMVKDVTHYFRNRLTAIGGFVRRIGRLSQGGSLKHYAEIVSHEVEDLEKEVSRLEEMWETGADRKSVARSKARLRARETQWHR